MNAFVRMYKMNRELVILLHGIGMSSLSMVYYKLGIEAAGYTTLNLDYPSRDYNAVELLDVIKKLIDEKESSLGSYTKVHFVGHSLGGIFARLLSLDYKHHNLGSCIALGSPNRGSELAYKLGSNTFIKWYFGPALLDLYPRSDFISSLCNLPGHYFLIAGREHKLSPFGFLLEKPSDGTVRVEEMIPDGLDERYVSYFNVSHSSMLLSRKVRDEIISFLRD